MIAGYLPSFVNHLWLSTLFAAAAGLLTLAFRKNRASVRYWLWLGRIGEVPRSLFAVGGHREPIRMAGGARCRSKNHAASAGLRD